MATWKMVREFLTENYGSVEVEGKYLRFPLKVEDHRFQKMIIVLDEDVKGDAWLHLMSPLGLASRYDMAQLLLAAGKYICGGFVIYEDVLYLRHSIPMEDMSPGELVTPLSMIAIAADAMEKQFLNVDEN